MIYFDNAATSMPKPPAVGQALAEAVNTLGNAGRGSHAPTLDAARMAYTVRAKIAKLINAPDPACIAFTCNATEGLNGILQGMFEPGDHIISTESEHNSVLRPLYMLQNSGAEVSLLKLDAQGRIKQQDLEKAVGPDTKALVLGHISNVTGNICDLKSAAAVAKKHRLLLIADAAQSLGSFPVDVQQLGIDILCFTGHKGLLGPQGTGGVYVRPGIAVRPFKAGGSGEQSFLHTQPLEMPAVLEAGTLNAHGLAGLNAALDFILATGVDNIHKQELQLAGYFVGEVSKIKQIKLYGDFEAEDRGAVVSLNVGTADSAVVSDILWEDYRICVRGGIHCAPLLHESMGTARQGMVRFSFGYYNTLEEVKFAVKALRKIAEELKCE